MYINLGAYISLNAVCVGMELCLLACTNDIDGLKAWLAAGADVNVADYDGRTALHVVSWGRILGF